MNPSAIELLICTREADWVKRYAGCLSTESMRVWESPADVPDGILIDVVLVDAATVDPQLEELGSLIATAGVVVVAAAGPEAVVIEDRVGDARLPHDCTERELRLACHLAAVIGRLRTQRDELARIGAQVTQLSETDPLTGLPNRRAWQRHWQSQQVRDASEGPPSWLVVIDLDGFKQVNDAGGMAQGDNVLLRAAHALAGQLRRQDIVARLGGDEFGILLSRVKPEHVESVLDRLRSAVAEQTAETPGGEAGKRGVTASIGYVRATSPNSTESAVDLDSLFAQAEQAMRRAKRAGGNRICRAVG